jgi:hydrogenase-4 component F
VLYAFWVILLAVPLAGNLGVAWLLVEATTAASALLVGFTGKPRALEAGWKYLVLTSLGLGVALLGIVILAAGIPAAACRSSRGRRCRPTPAGASGA